MRDGFGFGDYLGSDPPAVEGTEAFRDKNFGEEESSAAAVGPFLPAVKKIEDGGARGETSEDPREITALGAGQPLLTIAEDGQSITGIGGGEIGGGGLEARGGVGPGGPRGAEGVFV